MNNDDSVWSEGSVGSAGSRHSTGSVASKGSASRGSGSEAPGRVVGGGRMLDRVSADMHCCTFRLGGQLFGLDVGAVGEVFHVDRIVKVPLAPAGVLGLTNLRGGALAVIDLGAVLGLEIGHRPDSESGIGSAIVLRLPGMRFAATIDLVESVFPVHSADIRESAAAGEHPAIAGFLTLADDTVVSVLDLEEVTRCVQRLQLRSGTNAATEPAAERVPTPS